MNINNLGFRVFPCLCAAALLALAPLSGVQARQIVVDKGEFLPSSGSDVGCTIGLACAGVTLPFQFDFGSGLTDQAFIYNSGLISFGAEIPTSVDPLTTSFTEFGVPVIAPLFDPGPAFEISSETINPSSFKTTLPKLGVADLFVVSFLPVGFSDPSIVQPYTWLVLDGSEHEIRFEFIHGMSFLDQDGTFSLAEPSTNGRSLGFAVRDKVLKIDEPSLDGVFAYSISAVPEPGTWAMMIVGFGMMGALLRRRSAVVPAAAQAV